MKKRTLAAILMAAGLYAWADNGTRPVRNPGFEADTFMTPPGLAADNGGIRDWECTGSAGINPVLIEKAGKRRQERPILDNGKIPEGRNAAFVRGIGTLRQALQGLAPGRKWVLIFRENAASAPKGIPLPRLAVLLNERVIVADHAVAAVDPKGVFETPFRRIVSVPFETPPKGRVRLTFLVTGKWRAAVGIDAVEVRPYDGDAPPATRFEASGPVVLNSSFEADHYMRRPGYAGPNRGITAWQWQGNVGVNPCWGDRFRRWGGRSDFADNGRIPDGGQVAFIQSTGELRQRISGFRKGRRYRVVYYENGRVTRAISKDPVLEVLIGDRIIVSPHPVPAVEAKGRHTTPYFRVESAEFPAPPSGEADLVFRTLQPGGTSVLIDAIQIEEVR